MWWINDFRNCVGLSFKAHWLTENGPESTYYMYFWEVYGVIKYGWSAGEDTTLDEWVDKNEYRLKKANLDVERLVREAKKGAK